MTYGICNQNGYVIKKEKNDGSKNKSCVLIYAVKSNGYSDPSDMLKKLITLGCPDEDCSCELNTLCR